MAIEQLIKKGDLCLDQKEYLGALSAFGKAIEENPNAFQALLKRSIAYQRLKNYDAAKKDISEAFKIAEQRGSRLLLGSCYYRLGLVFCAEKDYEVALVNLKKAKDYDCQEATLDTWINKVEYDLKKVSKETDHKDHATKEASGLVEQKEESKSSTHVDTINKHAPLKVKIRDDWYQSSNEVIITIYAKNIKEDALSVQFQDRSLSISFPSADSSEYNYHLDPLYDSIDVQASSYKVYSTKLEIYLTKKDKNVKWPSLESTNDTKIQRSTKETSPSSQSLGETVQSYPSSSKKAINWANFNIPDEDVEEESEQDFFAKLYKNTDEDTRRAMMKSYIESNGTVLTTNWEEAKNKTFETSPPEGMVAKPWNENRKKK